MLSCLGGRKSQGEVMNGKDIKKKKSKLNDKLKKKLLQGKDRESRIGETTETEVS